MSTMSPGIIRAVRGIMSRAIIPITQAITSRGITPAIMPRITSVGITRVMPGIMSCGIIRRIARPTMCAIITNTTEESIGMASSADPAASADPSVPANEMDKRDDRAALAPEPAPAEPAGVAEETQSASASLADQATSSEQTAAQIEREAFLAALRTRLASSNYGLSAGLGLAFTPTGLLLFEAEDAQEALRAASAAIALAPDDDGREWRFVGNGPDLDTGRYHAVVRITPQS